ncbi:hypothetical protein VTP01DRAFT_6586 [Rhizomucor pusillus]|uniref:uncharacterized protein n=1 Tax=Rhizomucor pusillus TaxID=4840 RepID=UPI003743441B
MPLEHALQARGRFPDPGPWRQPSAVQTTLQSPLGIDTLLPRQKLLGVRRKPFQLNVMVVGESGLGKSTFVNTLFQTDIKDRSTPKMPQDTKTVEITPMHFELEEDGVILHLCLIDTPGFGDRLNRKEDVKPIMDYIDQQYSAYYEAEKHVGYRGAVKDTRVHACLYFISPTGHSLKELDIITLKELSQKLNVIPVIAKGDTLTPEEKTAFKALVLEDLERYGIEIYPHAYPDEDRLQFEHIIKHIPFAVMGSDTDVELPNGKIVKGRAYRWGTVEVDNPEHCDVAYLRELLIENCLHDITSLTHDHHYHGYRARLLRDQGRPESLLECDEDYDARIDESNTRRVQEMTQREEKIRQQFVNMVKETEDDLRRRERELQERRDQLLKELEEQQREISELEAELATKLSLKSK